MVVGFIDNELNVFSIIPSPFMERGKG